MTSTPLDLLLWCLDKNDQHIPWKMVAVKNGHDSHGIESVQKSPLKKQIQNPDEYMKPATRLANLASLSYHIYRESNYLLAKWAKKKV